MMLYRATTTLRKVLLARSRCYHTKECFGSWKKPYIPSGNVPPDRLSARAAEPNLWRLVCAYQEHGHRRADVHPLQLQQQNEVPELCPTYYQLDKNSNKQYRVSGIVSGLKKETASLGEIVSHLEKLYCGGIGLEVVQMTDGFAREWLVEMFEKTRIAPIPSQRRLELAKLLLQSQVFDNFLAKKFGTVKRYGAEGAEGLMAFFEETFLKAREARVSDVIICMPHRGRLNLLTGQLQVHPAHMFHKIKGNPEFGVGSPSTGDVLSHMVSSIDLFDDGDYKLHVTMLPNPSHLEAVNAVAVGKARARMLSLGVGPYSPHRDKKSGVLSVQVHGDAAFAAQGVVMETFTMANISHYEIGGSLHLVVNNYLGFTTPAEHARSSTYCSDIGKMVGCPILHVNGNHPEEVIQACQLAMDYQLMFENEIVVVFNCYRRWGHNELDDPSFTQPLMYKAIASRPSIPDEYWASLGDLGKSEDREDLLKEQYDYLNQCFKESDDHVPPVQNLLGKWKGMQNAPDKVTAWDTGFPIDCLKYIGAKSVSMPASFVVHSHLQKTHIESRLQRLKDGSMIDWATAEALAIGSLLYQGFNVRLSGQDVGRGTFSHRHAMLVDQGSDEAFIPLNSIFENQTASLEVANSPLTEEGALGFEYGFSIESPKHLVLWEAQFGDFFNGAQVMIDSYVSSGEAKWLLQSGLVMLLPHGYDGAGPDHSSCRIERFLQMCDSKEEGLDGDSVNMQVVHPSTPSQYFHLIRRQMIRNFRKPLVVASPKILLRLPNAVSSLQEMSPGTIFHPVLSDPFVTPKSVTRVVFCSGKHYYALDSFRRSKNITNTAIIRTEMLCPFPSGYLHRELSKLPNAKEFVWSQEEPANMGPWTFVEPRFQKQLGLHLTRVSRPAYGPPATGVAKVHQAEAKQLLHESFTAV